MAWPLPTELVAHGVWIWPEEASPLSPAWEVLRPPSAKHAALGEMLWAANRGPGTRVSEHLLTCTEPASLRLASRRCLSEALSPARSSRFCFTSTSIWARSSRWVAAQQASCLLNSSRSPETSCCSRCAGKEQGPLSGARGRWARCTPIYTPRPAPLQDCTPRPVPPGPSSPGPSILPTGLHSLDLQPQICTPLRLHSPGLHPSKAAPTPQACTPQACTPGPVPRSPAYPQPCRPLGSARPLCQGEAQPHHSLGSPVPSLPACRPPGEPSAF